MSPHRERAGRVARLALVVALCAGLVGSAVGAVAGAASRPADGVPSGPFTTVAVGPGETVEGDVTASGGRVVVAGTVEGDLRAYGAVVVLTEDAVVTGDVQAFGGRVVLAGEVRGPVTAYGGAVAVTGETGNLNAGGGTVRIAGRTGDATVLGARVVLAHGATVAGDFEYDARIVDYGGAVTGERRPTDTLLGPVGTVLRFAGWLPVLLALSAGPLGVALARVDARTDALAARARDAPVRSLLGGVVLALASLFGLLLLVVSVVGLPLLGLAGPLLLAGVLVSLAVATRAVGAVAADRLPLPTGAAGVVAAVLVAAFVAVTPLGVPLLLLLALCGAGTAAPGTRWLRSRAPLPARSVRRE